MNGIFLLPTKINNYGKRRAHKIEKNVRVLKVSMNRSGAGRLSPKLSLPTTWINDMKVTEEEPYILVEYDKEKKAITIRKQAGKL